jgi:Uma2 family endonuclease
VILALGLSDQYKQTGCDASTSTFTILNTRWIGKSNGIFALHPRVHISAMDLCTHPDISALCGEPQLEDDESDILLNPDVIMEVLSPSTEAKISVLVLSLSQDGSSPGRRTGKSLRRQRHPF